jgi:thiamine biosynthesis protein ThiI
VLLLLSGGIDSPVAGLRMMRRGCRVDAVHFHSLPYLDGSGREKARRLCAVLSRGQGATRLSTVAFGDIQSEIVRSVVRPLRVVLYRRMMMRIAARMARQDGAAALVTGDSLGQVASQTLANLSIVERASPLPVLRPLVGMDKQEIMQYAERSGTYEISILPDQDCCTLFVPRHPTTAARLRDVEEAEAALDVEGLVERACAARQRERIVADWQAAGRGASAARTG